MSALQPEGKSPVLLRHVRPLWSFQNHDIEAGPIASESDDLGTMVPYWVCWDISQFKPRQRTFRASAKSTGDGKCYFEIQVDGEKALTTPVLEKNGSAEINLPIGPAKTLTIIAHYVDGWFSAVRAKLVAPRLE